MSNERHPWWPPASHFEPIVGGAEIARFIGRSTRTLRRWMRQHDFPAMRNGRYLVTSPALIDAWIISRMRPLKTD
jgi:hypothetical protein